MNKPYDVSKIRSEFPILAREVHPGIQLVYLDSTATSQKPFTVIRVMDEYYKKHNGNIHRGVHTLAEEATQAYEEARGKIAGFIKAKKSRQIIYTRSTTESINLVAQTWGRKNLVEGDVIILSEMEHHSNLVPWQILAEEKNLRLEFIPVDENGQLDQDVFEKLLLLEPKLVAFTHMSNVLGTINPAKDMISKAKAAGATTFIDGAQSVPHFPVDVVELGADFLAFSAHKMVGPTGIGILYGREDLLETMPPYQGGGDMIKKVFLRSFIPNEIPYKFEAGTPAIAEAIGFGAAIDYLESIGMETIAHHERTLVSYAMEKLALIPGLKVIGEKKGNRGGVTSFTLEGIHPHDIAQILDQDGIAVRAGHHCAMPLHDRYKLPATTRASYYLYNTYDEIDKLIVGLNKVIRMFNG
jgi:cysteine desulfurase / selenocysteine lyase